VTDFVLLDRAGYPGQCSPAVHQRTGEFEPDDMATALLYVSGAGLEKSVSAVADELTADSDLVPISIQGEGTPLEKARFPRFRRLALDPGSPGGRSRPFRDSPMAAGVPRVPTSRRADAKSRSVPSLTSDELFAYLRQVLGTSRPWWSA
jgi:hypothetical protein